MLKKLLHAKTDSDKTKLRNILECIRYMQKKEDLDWKQLQTIKLILVKDYQNCMPERGTLEHLPMAVFAKAASQIMNILEIEETVLHEKLKACLVDPQHHEEEHISIANLTLLIELFQYMPTRKSLVGDVRQKSL